MDLPVMVICILSALVLPGLGVMLVARLRLPPRPPLRLHPAPLPVQIRLHRLRQRGQSVIIFALAAPVVVFFVLLLIEVAERQLEVQMAQDALQQATRSAVQQLDYAYLAADGARVRVTRDCIRVAWDEPACRPVTEVARRILITNLQHVRGLDETPEALAARVRWTVLPGGGTCTASIARVPPVSAATPLLCAEVRPVMRGLGLTGWGPFTPPIVAADTLDPVLMP